MMSKPLFWNIRGLGTSRRRLRKIVKSMKPNFLMLTEPFSNEAKLKLLQNNLHFEFYFFNQNIGGKLWLLWGDGLQVSVLNASAQHVTIFLPFENQQIYISIVYVKCRYQECRELWLGLQPNQQKSDPDPIQPEPATKMCELDPTLTESFGLRLYICKQEWIRE